MIDIIIIQINGLILVAKPIKNETTELVLPIISEIGIRLEFFYRTSISKGNSNFKQTYTSPKEYLKNC